LARALVFIRPGDCLVVWKLDRLGRSLPHLLTTVTDFKKRGIASQSLTEQMDTTTPQGEFLFQIFGVTDAARHDSAELDAVLGPDNTSSQVWAGSAYRSAEIEEKLADRGFKSRIHRRGARNCPLLAREQQGNVTRSQIRARVEHVFGHQANAMGGKFLRTIGLVRARAKIGMQNL
jgi:hypothetical protein